MIDLPDDKFYDTIEQYQKWQEETEKWTTENLGIPKKYLENDKMTQEETLNIALEVAKKTIGYEIEPVKFEDIPNKIGEFVSKCLHKNVKVEGNGLTSDIIATIEE